MLGGRDQHLRGWTNVDLHEGPDVDIRTDVSDLSLFKDGTAAEIYASHILEHFGHTKTVDVLKEWRRVLAPGGKAFISVPDFQAILILANSDGFSPFIRNILYGDQGYALAFHYTCFTFGTLAAACVSAGFRDVKRLASMPYGLADCSTLVDTYNAKPISVHVEALA